PGWPGFRAGSDGTVWSRWRRRGRGRARGTIWVLSEQWREARTRDRGNGYLAANLRRNRDGQLEQRCEHVHTLVLTAFRGPRPAGREACHNDGDRANNGLENLRWDTHKANAADARRHGATLVGSRVVTAKLDEDRVRAIRFLLSRGVSGPRIAR